jgi:hypothetical protein
MQAYPFQHKDPTTGLTNISVGMTLRDYFAAQAMTQAFKEVEEAENYNIMEVAAIAYQYADAMLEARK